MNDPLWLYGITLGWGLVLCLAGYRLFKVAIAIILAFVAALYAGDLLAARLPDAEWALMLGRILGAVVGFFIGVWAYLGGVFLAGFSLGIGLGESLVGLIPQVEPPWILLSAGLVLGLLSLWAQKVVACLATAILGGWGITTGVLYFWRGKALLDYARVGDSEVTIQVLNEMGGTGIGIWFVISLAGFIYQSKVVPGSASDRKDG
ncbi:MAG: DUF4203 domain-containing protein [Opitutales bacterium]